MTDLSNLHAHQAEAVAAVTALCALICLGIQVGVRVGVRVRVVPGRAAGGS